MLAKVPVSRSSVVRAAVLIATAALAAIAVAQQDATTDKLPVVSGFVEPGASVLFAPHMEFPNEHNAHPPLNFPPLAADIHRAAITTGC